MSDLPRQPCSRGAERQAHGVLAAAHPRAGQQQAGEVRAGDQDNGRGRDHQYDHFDPRVAEHLFAHRDDHGPDIAIASPDTAALSSCRDRLHLASLRLRRPRRASGGRPRSGSGAARVGGLRRRKLHRDPVVDVAVEEHERLRGDANHLELCTSFITHRAADDAADRRRSGAATARG